MENKKETTLEKISEKTEINWKIRVMQVSFWIALIPAIFLFVQAVLLLFGFEYDFSQIQDKLLGVVVAFFGILSVIGVVRDFTSPNTKDSVRVQGYIEPGKPAIIEPVKEITTERIDGQNKTVYTKQDVNTNDTIG